MQIDPNHLIILAAVVDEGGLTQGAAALGKSQPSLSRSLSALEARLGLPLFEKGRRPLIATELGAALAAQGRLIRAAAAEASVQTGLYAGGKTGAVRVAGTPVFMDAVIASMIAGFQQANPNVRIDQSYGYADTLIRDVQSGTLDMALCPLPPDAVPEGLTFDEILQGRNVIACRIGHPLARKKTLRLSDIAPYPWIAPPTASPLYQDLKAILAEIEVDDFRVSFSGGSISAVRTVLEGSDSLTILPYSVLFMMRHHKSLTALDIRIRHAPRHLGILSAQASSDRPVVRRFQRHLAHEFKSLARTITHQQQASVWGV
ncbi:LysR family transcriptional regulator [uncultured Tateyamaria sp.]|uniref:LysR family transcriptional regulator n=1 Tax=uncultured Tateyamaria sp. TaxID=455651 RepID=UPI00262B7A30|nr:LysR family transcriptional regulator [uncultured Tateyamaria sp.]